ncbi:MAG: SGNH/GDSL hydrolase family protein [Proteobacteria bacterium]|nr:SGNH/GDSL hydrolase family protein [Pseudomonadota bacterium]
MNVKSPLYRRGALLVAASACLAVSVGCAMQEAASTSPLLQAGAAYVALGSSYAAGAGIGPLQPGSPPRCQRTTNNYASLLARRFELALTDASCGGAMTAHLLGPWNELPAQLESVTAAARVVTVTVGGNDLDYMGALFGGSCRAGVVSRPGPCPPVVQPSAAQYQKLESALNAIAREISRRAPQARVVFVQYVAVVPDNLCAATQITPEDAANGRAIGRQLALVTARVATANGALVLPADELSRDHSPCAPEPWSRGLYGGYDMQQGAPWHPAPAGHAAIAAELARLLQR